MDLHKFEQRLGIYRGTSLVGYGVIKCECVTFILAKTDLLVQGTRKKYVFFAKQDPGRTRQNS